MWKMDIVKVYRDRYRISNYVEESVDYLSKVKILLEDSNSNFNPKGNIAVEKSYLTLIRLFKSYITKQDVNFINKYSNGFKRYTF